MKKSTLISIIAVITAMAGILIALAAYFNKKRTMFCDDFEDDLLSEEPDDVEYYAAHLDDECECGCCHCAEAEAGQEEDALEETEEFSEEE